MKSIKFDLKLYDCYPVDLEVQKKQLLYMLEALVACYCIDIRAGKTFRERVAHCDSLAPQESDKMWLCAELRERGLAAVPYLEWRKLPTGATMYLVNAKIRNEDGSLSDVKDKL